MISWRMTRGIVVRSLGKRANVSSRCILDKRIRLNEISLSRSRGKRHKIEIGRVIAGSEKEVAAGQDEANTEIGYTSEP